MSQDLQHFCYFLFGVLFLVRYTFGQNANKHVLLLEYSYIELHMIDNFLFNVENIIILPSSIIHFMEPFKFSIHYIS